MLQSLRFSHKTGFATLVSITFNQHTLLGFPGFQLAGFETPDFLSVSPNHTPFRVLAAQKSHPESN
jgi:hypothetical protein